MRFALLIWMVLINVVFFAQTQEIDSLKTRLRSESNLDTIQAFDLNELAWQYLDYSLDSTAHYCTHALSLSRKIGYQNGVIDAKNTLGVLYRFQKKTAKAILLYEEIIALRIQSNQYDRLTGAYSNLGSVYFENADYAKALKNYQKAFDNANKFKQEENQLVLLNNIGVAYKLSGLYEQALEAFQKGLKMNKTIQNDYQEAQLYLNIATVYDQRQLFKESVKYNKHAYVLLKKENNLRQLSTVVYNLTIGTREIRDFEAVKQYLKEMEVIANQLNEDEYTCLLLQSKANFYMELGNHAKALAEVNNALSIVDSSENLMLYAKLLLVQADAFRYLGRYDEALLANHESERVTVQFNDPVELAGVYSSKYEIYKAKGDFKQALIFFEKTGEIRAQIALDEVNSQIATMNSLNELDMKDKQLELTNKEKEKVETENRRQFLQLVASLIIGILVLILLFFSVRAYRLKQKANFLLLLQKTEIEEQKATIEEKQTEILDSIHYAKRIQSTLLTQESVIRNHVPDCFLFFQPKDIVSGDFYWATEHGNRFYLAVCDSTGHGVPGAFMSLLNSSFLNEAINERQISEPHEILNHVRSRLIESISQDGAQDGMDGILLCFNRTTNTISYAASHNRPLLVSAGELIEFPADKMPIGKGERHDSFTLHTISATPGSMLYLFTDGYPDQFGGPKGKKFKYRQLEELVVTHAEKSTQDQFAILAETFQEWKGELEQVDDVTVVGIRI